MAASCGRDTAAGCASATFSCYQRSSQALEQLPPIHFPHHSSRLQGLELQNLISQTNEPHRQLITTTSFASFQPAAGAHCVTFRFLLFACETPTLALKERKPWLAFSTPCGDGQDQTLLQASLNVAELGMNPQEAVEAPRFNSRAMYSSFDDQSDEPLVLDIEKRVPEAVLIQLRARAQASQLARSWDDKKIAGALSLSPSREDRSGWVKLLMTRYTRSSIRFAQAHPTRCLMGFIRTFLALLFVPLIAAQGSPEGSQFSAWMPGVEIRLTPASFSRELKTTAVAEAFGNEVVSLQLAVRAKEPLDPFRAGEHEANFTINRHVLEFTLPDLPAARKTSHRLLAEVTGKPRSEPSPYTSDARITAKFSPEDFVPDGDLTKEAWQKAAWVRFDHSASGRPSFPQAETRVASLWTATHVYFAFQCKYSTLNIYAGEDPAKERWELWNRDVVEVFANPEPARVNHYYEFEVAPTNQWIDLEIDKDKVPFNDASWDSNFEHATRVDAKNHVWTCEMRIPVWSMNVLRVEPNTEWRINFYRADGPGDGSRRRFMSWSTIPEGRTFHVPTRFGIIRFVR